MEKIKEATVKIRGLDYNLMEKTQHRLDSLTKPQGSLGRLEELAKLIVGITKEESPTLKNKVIFTLAADHGAAEMKVSAYPQEVTAQMVYNFLRGGAGINVLANQIGARVIVVDMGVAEKIKNPYSAYAPRRLKNIDFKEKKINYGTKNFAKTEAMTKDEAIRSVEAGIEAFKEELPKGIDIVGTGDMGIANTTSSSAIAAVFTGKPIEEVTGRGTGIDDKSFTNKIDMIKKAIKMHKPDPKNPIDVLTKIGGFEIGGLSGIIIAAASARVPVVIDGFISGAAALIAYCLEPKIKDYLIASHCSVEKGHKAILGYIGLNPLLDLKLRLGEGSGAALGISLAEASIKILTQMATFQDAEVSRKIE